MKATYCEIDGVGKEIFKDPKTVTTSGMTKKSLRGLIAVLFAKEGGIVAVDQVAPEVEADESTNLLQTVFEDGKIVRETTLDEIRKRRDYQAYVVVRKSLEV